MMPKLWKNTTRRAMTAGALVMPLILSACAGSSTTYGTGQSSTQQFLSGLGGMLGSPEKKAPIDYSSRPGLISPQQSAELPKPVEFGSSSYSANLPEDPEKRQARNIAEAPKANERSGELPVEFMKRKKVENSQPEPVKKWDRDGTLEFDYDPSYNRERVLKYKAEIAGVQGAVPRRYLTEPPRSYRTPVDTAPIGEVGIDESVKEKKRQGKKSFSWSDLNPFS